MPAPAPEPCVVSDTLFPALSHGLPAPRIRLPAPPPAREPKSFQSICNTLMSDKVDKSLLVLQLIFLVASGLVGCLSYHLTKMTKKKDLRPEMDAPRLPCPPCQPGFRKRCEDPSPYACRAVYSTDSLPIPDGSLSVCNLPPASIPTTPEVEASTGSGRTHHIPWFKREKTHAIWTTMEEGLTRLEQENEAGASE